MAPSGGKGDIAVEEAPEMAPGGAWDDDAAQGGNPGNSTSEEAPEGGGNYEETTDNQVEGVIEADLLKRSSTHAFYLTGVHSSIWNENGYYESVNAPLLRVYSIAGAASKQVESYRIEPDAGMKFRSTVTEMYLSEDCTTLTVFSSVYGGDQGIYTAVISLDVSDPTDVSEISRVYLSGGYLSSRLVNGELLVINAYRVSYQPDFDDESTFLPQYGDGKDMQSVAAEDIVCPDVATSTSYTVVTKLDGKTLEVEDSVALLSYSEQVYVSATNLFLTQNYTDIDELGGGKWEQLAKTNISCVNYADEGLQVTGTACVDGRVKNQYSMDEYENVLRVVTTYSRTVFEERNGYGYNWMTTLSSETNASLYCIDLTSFERVASVEKFAPTGETAESVRFNGTKAYEGFFRVNLGNRFFPIAEVGWGVSDHTDETTQIHYKSNAPYFRIGCDYNVANDKKSGNRIFFGLRYAFTSFKYDLDGPDLADPVYGDAMPFSFHGLKGGQHWLELAGGLEARICRFFHIGWTLRYRQRIHEKKADVGSAWYVPGYGKQGNHAISGTFNLVFDL